MQKHIISSLVTNNDNTATGLLSQYNSLYMK
jgi:hypothetical protein